MDKINNLMLEMIKFNAGEAKLIQHLLKVYEFSRLIGNMENIDHEEMEILEAAALVHDIAIKKLMEKYGKQNGQLQEEEGPKLAEEMLRDLEFSQNVIDRVSYLVAHHHTYTNIDGMDYQILVEADFLVNLYEKESNLETIQNAYDKIFKTESGRKICSLMFMEE